MAFSPFAFPPLDYSLLFPDLVNFHMERNARFPIFVYVNENVPNTLTEVSFLEFGRATHRVAHALRPSRQGLDGEVIMIIANTDTILYQAVFVGLLVAGWVPFPVSPRNSAVAVVDMMKKTNCSHIVTLDHVHKGLIDGIRRENNGAHLTIYEMPPMRCTFPKLGKEVVADAFIPYPPPSKRPDLDSVAIYLHSSGSTGTPKPIAHSHRLQIQWLAQSLIRSYSDLTSPRCIGSMAPPPFHIFGIVTQIYVPFACLVTALVYPPRTENDPLAYPVIPTSDNMIACLKKKECNVFFTVPAFLEQMARSKEAIRTLKTVDVVRFGGGPLPVKVGDALCAAGVRLCNVYGATEFGVPVAMADEQDVANDDWIWMRFSEDLKIRWDPQGDDMYELQILSTKDRQMAVENLPDVKGYATSDVFVKHPTKDVWRIIGRTDDVITLASGEKTVPAPMESIIGSSPLVQGVVMFGRERNQVGVLIEPRHAVDVEDRGAVAEFRNHIWPVIEEANNSSPAFSRIFKEMILITSKNKPMWRAGKGTVQRKATLDAYEAEINAVYDAVEASSVTPDGLAEPSTWTSEALKEWLLEHARSISSNHQVDPSTDLFVQGFDSLSATYLRNRILGALRKSADPKIKTAVTRIPANLIFENQTIQLLSLRIAALVNDTCIVRGSDSREQRIQAIKNMIKKYSAGLHGFVDGIIPGGQPIEPAVVLLTGTTGNLGPVLLSELLQSSTVQRVFAFNRPSSTKAIAERQRSAFEEKGLPIDLLDSCKLVYIEADATLQQCGLSPVQYKEIRNSLTLIIHNAWRVDFNLSISSFEDNVRASRNLIDLGLDSTQKNLRFLFMSSVASGRGWDDTKGPFPEEVQLDPATAIGSGYGESKYATERIIVKSGLPVTSLRIGQIAGGRGGSWATSDWFPILVISSIALEAFPEIAGVLSWLRQEDVAAAILEMAFAQEAPPPALNLVSPRSVPWAKIISYVRRSVIKQKGLGVDVFPIIPFKNWLTLLENKAENACADDLENIPAIKLLGFFRALAQRDEAIQRFGTDATETMDITNCSTANAERLSPTMAKMQAIGEADADAWVGYWISRHAF